MANGFLCGRGHRSSIVGGESLCQGEYSLLLVQSRSSEVTSLRDIVVEGRESWPLECVCVCVHSSGDCVRGEGGAALYLQVTRGSRARWGGGRVSLVCSEVFFLLYYVGPSEALREE